MPVVACALRVALPAQSDRPWQVTDDGRFVVTDPSPDRPWPEDLEHGFQRRALHVVRGASRDDGRYGNTWFENEKRSYGVAMLSWLAGHEDAARRFLQAPDAGPREWSAHTAGIDLFPAFTLKHQVRKWFYFGRWLDDDHRERMREAFRLWTERDPLRRPHPAFRGADGWTPEARNSWVDVRSTDNLKLMRDVAIHLLAAEAGNAETRDRYAAELRRTVAGIYRYGPGEWDSENYLGHSIAPLLSLHDFAPDPAMRDLARAALDWLTITAALKYRRGVFGGPDRRDYDHGYAFGGSAASMLWLWFGDAPMLPERFESDEIHAITSGYRPPRIAVELALERLARPVTMHATKPDRAPWLSDDAPRPAFHETLHFGHRFQLGTLARGTQAPDVNGFTLMVDHPERGADVLLVAPTADATAIASPRYQDGALAPTIRVLQHGPTAIHLVGANDRPLLFALPAAVEREVHDGVAFLRWPGCWAAIVPVGASVPTPDAGHTRTRDVRRRKVRGTWVEEPRRPGAPASVVLVSEPTGRGAYGFVLEVGEVEQHGDFDSFRKEVVTRAGRLERDADTGRVAWELHDGSRLALRLGTDGAPESRTLDGDPLPRPSDAVFGGPILHQDRGSGRLTVQIDGEVAWSTAVDPDGVVSGSSAR